MTDEERKIALYCLKVSSDYHSEVCQECIKFHNCDHAGKDDVTETIIKALEQEPCEDCISRQAVLEGIAKWVEDGYADSEADISHISSLVTHLPSVTPTQEWIPCSDRLPEEKVEVLVTTECGNITIAERYSANDYFINDGAATADEDEITAWMPLPKPYEGDKKDD